MLEIALGSVGDGAAGAAHAHKIACGSNGAATTDPPQLTDPLEIQATTPIIMLQHHHCYHCLLILIFILISSGP